MVPSLPLLSCESSLSMKENPDRKKKKSNYFNYLSRRLLCHTLIQPHFDYGCTSQYSLLSKTLKTNLQIVQNKCIRYCLELPSPGHINPSHFRKLNWLPVEHRVELCTSTTVFKCWKRIAPSYLNNMFMPSLSNSNTRSQIALVCLFVEKSKNKKYVTSWTKHLE